MINSIRFDGAMMSTLRTVIVWPRLDPDTLELGTFAYAHLDRTCNYEKSGIAGLAFGEDRRAMQSSPMKSEGGWGAFMARHHGPAMAPLSTSRPLVASRHRSSSQQKPVKFHVPFMCASFSTVYHNTTSPCMETRALSVPSWVSFYGTRFASIVPAFEAL